MKRPPVFCRCPVCWIGGNLARLSMGLHYAWHYPAIRRARKAPRRNVTPRRYLRMLEDPKLEVADRLSWAEGFAGAIAKRGKVLIFIVRDPWREPFAR